MISWHNKSNYPMIIGLFQVLTAIVMIFTGYGIGPYILLGLGIVGIIFGISYEYRRRKS